MHFINPRDTLGVKSMATEFAIESASCVAVLSTSLSSPSSKRGVSGEAVSCLVCPLAQLEPVQNIHLPSYSS